MRDAPPPPCGDRPLVTLYLLSYNRERTLAAALSGAFAQTYSPLEILISDNHSTDGSYKLITERAAAYRGPHTLTLNRNEANLGLIGNVNRAFALARGELLVINCDDDISHPDRVRRLVEAWLAYGRKPTAIASSYAVIGPDGRERSRHLLPRAGLATTPRDTFLTLPNPVADHVGCGAAMAYHRDVFRVFGPITNPRVVDDQVLLRRARLLGDLLTVPDVLLSYRVGEGESTRHTTHFQETVQWLAWSAESCAQTVQDLERVRDRLGDAACDALRQALGARLRRTLREQALYTGARFSERWPAYRALLDRELLARRDQLAFATAALLPRRAAEPLIQTLLRLKRAADATFRRSARRAGESP